MQVYPVPGCCTARLLIGFGRGKNVGWTLDDVPTKEDLQKVLLDLKNRGYGLILAITNSAQKKGRKLLKAEGFKTTRGISSNLHKDTKTYLHYLNVQDYQNGN